MKTLCADERAKAIRRLPDHTNATFDNALDELLQTVRHSPGVLFEDLLYRYGQEYGRRPDPVFDIFKNDAGTAQTARKIFLIVRATGGQVDVHHLMGEIGVLMEDGDAASEVAIRWARAVHGRPAKRAAPRAV